MESVRSERGGEEQGQEERCSQEETNGRLQESAEDPPVPECGSQEQLGPEPDDLNSGLHPDHSHADEHTAASTNSVQEHDAQMLLIPHLSNLHTSENMEPLPEDEEEEELIVLDSKYPIYITYQEALNSHLTKKLERINLELKEKEALEKADAQDILEIDVEMFRVQEQLARAQTRLQDLNHSTAQSKAKRQQAQAQLEAAKAQHSSVTIQYREEEAIVSQLQVELDRLMQHLAFTEAASEGLHSNVKAMKNVRCKAGSGKNQAEEQKLKQDLYVERLTKDKERLMQQIAMYEAQATAQAEETQAVKEALCESEMELESLVMARKQLLQQWSSSLLGMGRREEALSTMQEALRTANHQLILLDREIEDYKKSITEEQEQNEMLTMQLNWSQMDCASTKKLISQKQEQQEAMQAHLSASLHTLKETELSLARLSEESTILQAEVSNQRRQLETETALRLGFEDKIMTHMKQKLTHKRAAKYSQKLTSNMTALKKEKISQLWQLENDIAAVELEKSHVGQHLATLALTQETLDEEIAKYNKLLTSEQAKISSFTTLIRQKQDTISSYNKKIHEIAASTGHEDLSPFQIKIQAIMAQIDELSLKIKSDQQLWMKRQGTLVGLTQEIEMNSKRILKLQTEYTGMQQKKIHLESQIEVAQREETELLKNTKTLRGDLLRLNRLLSKKEPLKLALEQENRLMEKDFLCRLKDAEQESIEMQMKLEKTQEDKERLINSLVEAERQIMLWEKKIQLAKEIRSVVEVGQKEVQIMKAEIHRMELRLNHLMKQQERLQRESVAMVARRENIDLRKEAMARSSHKQTSKGELKRVTQRLRSKIHDTRKQVAECEQVIRDLQESKASMSDRLMQQQQKLTELCGTGNILDTELVNLQDIKDRNLAHLVALQSRNKKLQEVREGSYQASSTRESVDAALQRQMERVRTISTIVHRVCEEFPQHKGALCRVSRALAEHAQGWSRRYPESEGGR